ncbi:MAG: N-formylglutamate amidohydrolase, partial [Deltaproteobacteria bacterium]|nr:N-formylglutamate amidohydrolase [Deltaproteobacteria bacterium]
MKGRLHQTGRTAAWEAYDVDNGTAPVVLSCEHASVELPDGYRWSSVDAWLVGTHWCYDIGAAELARDLATALGCPAVFANFSRLICDPNRVLDSPTLFRRVAEGRPVDLNRKLTDLERAARVDRFYHPYHERLEAAVAARPGAAVLAVHTFTPVFEGERRHLEVGVLFDRDEGMASEVTRALVARGVGARPNEPYSGRHGMMFSAQHHADRHGRAAL